MVKKLSVEIPKASANEIFYIPKGDIGDFKKDIEWRFSKTETLVWLGFIVVVLMAAGIVQDAWRAKENSYNALLEKISTLDVNVQVRGRDEMIDKLNARQKELEQEIQILRSDLQNVVQPNADDGSILGQ